MSMNEQDLLAGLGRLPREREPEADLWPGISGRLRHPVSRIGRIPLAAAAALMGAVISYLGLTLTASPEVDTQHQWLQEPPASGAGLVLASGVDLEYSGVLREMAGQMRVWSVDSPGKGALEANLKVLVKASDDLREAIASDPESVYLAHMLESTQRKQLAVMRELLMQRDNVGDAPIDQRST